MISSLTGPIMAKQPEDRAGSDGQGEVPHGHLPGGHLRVPAAAQRSARLVNLPQAGDCQHWGYVGTSTEQTNFRKKQKLYFKNIVFVPLVSSSSSYTHLALNGGFHKS